MIPFDLEESSKRMYLHLRRKESLGSRTKKSGAEVMKGKWFQDLFNDKLNGCISFWQY